MSPSSESTKHDRGLVREIFNARTLLLRGGAFFSIGLTLISFSSWPFGASCVSSSCDRLASSLMSYRVETPGDARILHILAILRLAMLD